MRRSRRRRHDVKKAKGDDRRRRFVIVEKTAVGDIGNHSDERRRVSEYYSRRCAELFN